MENTYFLGVEGCSDQTQLPLMEVIDQLAFNEQGLIPVITQDNESKCVLKMYWMNKASLLRTLESG